MVQLPCQKEKSIKERWFGRERTWKVYDNSWSFMSLMDKGLYDLGKSWYYDSFSWGIGESYFIAKWFGWVERHHPHICCGFHLANDFVDWYMWVVLNSINICKSIISSIKVFLIFLLASIFWGGLVFMIISFYFKDELIR